ncbi:MAG: hypothetical protein SWK90_14205 [Chloroflexota bacterium]|nr:hypothetical protein [Chloroflexota bacterium]
MTIPRPWPNWAKEARDRAAEEAVRGMRALRPLVEGKMAFDRTEVLRRQAITLDALQQVARFLEGVGAQTRPE